VHREQDRVRVLCRLARRTRARPGLAGELLELLPIPGIAEDDLVSGAREERSELAAHQA
jgi:hypothetical protein